MAICVLYCFLFSRSGRQHICTALYVRTVCVFEECAHTFIVSIGVCGDDSVVIVNALEHVDGDVIPAADEVAVAVDPYITTSK